MIPRFFLSAALVATLAVSAPAVASDPAAAEALFQAGKGLMDKKNYAEACPKFEASYKLDPAIGTLLNLADCHERQGLLARAWVDWGEARDKAKREGDKPRADLASRRQTSLEPRVPKITVNVTGPVEGFDVYRDNTKLDPAMLGVALPVDPGPHTITIRRGADVLKESRVESKERAKDEVTLDATDLPPPPPGQTAQSGAIAPVKTGGVEMVRRSKGMMAGGIVMASIGGVVTPVGLLLLMSDADKGVGWGTTLVGAGMIGGGIALAVVGAKKVPKKPEKPRAELFIGPSSVMVRGQF
ncbi:tetratricopeptide repeat protein [Polyangium aurulentum]|uniref:tetratricopeptide repeat protein n=1 Tax=Polyangium aurulentum TaxID=2567896 RepID=UPI0010ADFE6D|nr:hypothetical protein [Polyangium aurulentum]UQA61026.1 hypothetical protein E8A73_011330 [Polyangium aurulentum]